MKNLFRIVSSIVLLCTAVQHFVFAQIEENEVMATIPAEPEVQVTLANWTHPPFNRWAFRNVGIHPSVMVTRSDDTVRLPSKPNQEIASLEFRWDGKTYTVRDAMLRDETDGIVVIHDGSVVYEEYFGDFTEHDYHLWASSTKSFTGLCLGILVGQGKIDPTKLVETYLPELKDTYFGQRTVREVLNMVSALGYSEDYVAFTEGAPATEYFKRVGFIPGYDLVGLDPTKDDTPRGILAFLPKFEANPDLDPGEKFEYHSPNVDVAGWIVSRVSGMPLNKFAAAHVWSKLGVEHDAFFWTDLNFNPVATGGFNTTLRDFARIGLAVQNNGFYNGHQVFPESWIKDTFALTDEERRHGANSDYRQEGSPIYDPWLEGYKNFLWVHDSKERIGSFRGVFGQVLYINQDARVVIATFSSALSASNASREANKPRMAAFDAIAEHLNP